MELKQQTRDFTEDGKGLGMAALQAIGASAAAQAEGEVPENADLWMAVMVFLTRRAAGRSSRSWRPSTSRWGPSSSSPSRVTRRGRSRRTLRVRGPIPRRHPSPTPPPQ
jgi:hypothetical protein